MRLAFVGLPVGLHLVVHGRHRPTRSACSTTLGPKGRAAAALGIYTDTSALLHGATALDFRMFEKLTRDEATDDVLDELRDYRVPPEWYHTAPPPSTTWRPGRGAHRARRLRARRLTAT